MIVNIKQIQQKKKKIAKEEIGTDGYVGVDCVYIVPTTYWVISGNGGKIKRDGSGKYDWNEDFRLEFKDGQSWDFVKGIFYKTLRDILED